LQKKLKDDIPTQLPGKSYSLSSAKNYTLPSHLQHEKVQLTKNEMDPKGFVEMEFCM